MAWGDPIPRPAHYGGNKIPNRYLDAFNRRTDDWLRKIGARPKDKLSEGLPGELAAFVEDI